MAEVEVRFKILGREVTLDRVGDLNLKTTLGNAASEVKKKLRGCTCPDHNEPGPRVEISGLSAHSLNYKVDGCCDSFIDQAKQALR